MSGGGFLGPDEGRLDRLDLLITEALRQLDRSVLSPEAQEALENLESKDAWRQELARRLLAEEMAADPIDSFVPSPEQPGVPVDESVLDGIVEDTSDDDVVADYQCRRKRRFDSWDQADRAALVSWAETKSSVNPPGPYPCSHCSGYHIGRTGHRRHRRQLSKARKWFRSTFRDQTP